MTNTRRGFGRERHSGLKVGLTGIALAGFVVAWVGFGDSHGAAGADLVQGSPAAETPTVPSRTPIPVGTPATGATVTPAPTRAVDEEPQPLATRAKRSRAS